MLNTQGHQISIELLSHATIYALTAMPSSGMRRGLLLQRAVVVLYTINAAMVEKFNFLYLMITWTTFTIFFQTHSF